ncbi:MAG: glycosyltransferase family 4 protein [Leptolyngbyaceae cyanobacterium SM1_1_3]|nr:glycosyltransferase family 4 protein [Leptolyngbyaceae cyanobacterium SM1_1_3]NJN02668.1 glycosyltransferase family 4 protein [Leptolyngbyaceae cyanobacterium RM1_1_2]NJO11183.1 glycosyltransferase family 4 protein [Leptolyngbyaceae cyanobacterium SL_1_1]
MHLLYTVTAYPPSLGGAQIHHHLLAQQMQQRGHTLQAVTHWDSNRTDWLLGTTLRSPTTPHPYTLDGISVHRLGLSWLDKLRLVPFVALYYPLMPLALPAIAGSLTRQLAPYAQPADLIHNVRMGREGISYASYQAARQQDIPFVFTPVHHPRWVGWRYRAYINLYRQADAVIALTPAEKKVLIELGVAEQKIQVTGIGPVLAEQADGDRLRQALNISGPIVLFLGQHYEYKGYRELLVATARVWQQFPETHFVFVGPGVRQSEQYFQQFQDARIHRLGAVSLQQKTDALAACYLLCVPSAQESFGGIYTEAWCFAKPVIGCNIAAVADVIDEGKNGFLVAQDPAAIAERIGYLLEHPAQAAAMGRAGQQKVENCYTWQRLAAKTEAVYKQIL